MTETIVLGGRQFTLQPLKLGQLRQVLDALDQMSGKSGGALVTAAAQVAAAGLAPAHPDISADIVLDLEATLDELNTAVAAILRTAGLQPQALANPPPQAGEGRVGAPGENPPVAISAPSTAPSPPAAVMPTP